MRRFALPGAAAALALAAIALRQGGLSPSSLWFDDSWVAAGVRMPVSDLPKVGLTSPGFALIVRGASTAFGTSPLVFQVPAFVFAVLTPVALLATLRERGVSWPGAVAAAATIVASPVAIQYSVAVKQYTADGFLTVLLIWLVWRLTDAPELVNRWWHFVGTACVAMWISGTMATLSVSLGVVPLIVLVRRVGWRRATGLLLAPLAVAAICAGALYLVVLGPQVGGWLKDYWDGYFLNPGEGFGIVSAAADLLGSVLRGWTSLPTKLSGLAVVAAAVVLLRGRSAVLAIAAAPFALAVVLAAAEVAPLGGGRTDSHLHVALSVLVGAAIGTPERATRSSGPRFGAALGAVWIAALVLAGPETPDYVVEDVRPEIEYVQRHREASDVILVYPPTQYNLALYTPGPVQVDGDIEAHPAAPYGIRFSDQRIIVMEHHRDDPAEYQTYIDAAVGAGDRVWFLASHLCECDIDVILDQLDGSGYRRVESSTSDGAHVSLWVAPDP